MIKSYFLHKIFYSSNLLSGQISDEDLDFRITRMKFFLQENNLFKYLQLKKKIKKINDLNLKHFILQKLQLKSFRANLFETINYK